MPVNGTEPARLASPEPLATAVARAAGNLPQDLGILMGWSLGGQIAYRAHSRCAGLVLIATPPSFLARPSYPAGMAEEVFREFRAAVAADPGSALQRFFALQFRGDEADRRQWAAWRDAVLDWQRPAEDLVGWLDVLAATDLATDPDPLTVPTLVVHGEGDQVVDPAATQFFAGLGADVTVRPIAGAGHAPHISHPEEVAEAIGRFVRYVAGW